MVANVGRAIKVYWGDESPQPLVAGVREKTPSLNGDPVDVTDDDDSGWRTLLNNKQVRNVDIPVSGVLVNDTLRADWFNGNWQQAATLEYPDGGTITGTFHLSGYSEGAPHDGEITFEATFMSSGPVTYTPGP